MVTKIKLEGIATFTNKVEINNIQKINFFYGSNGTGKTTISKLLNSSDYYPGCKVEWRNNKKIKTIVFNENFVRKIFYESENFQGIFTLGKEATEIEDKIKNKNVEKKKIEEERTSLANTLKTKDNELSSKLNEFQKRCWEKIYKKYENTFDDIFSGYKKSKEKLADRILNKFSEYKPELKTKEYLVERYNFLYKEELKPIDELNLISEDIINELKTLEKDEILKTKIIGKKDIEIAKMIEKLQNHDWVRQGKQYYEKNYDEKTESYICPFCQQSTTEEFKKKLEEYFDETYKKQVNDLNNLLNNYVNFQKYLNNYFDGLMKTENNKYFDENKETLRNKILVIQERLKNNISLLERKQAKPSESIEVDSTTQLIEEFNDLIISINSKIKEHNNLIINQKDEIKRLESEIWKFFHNEINTDIQNYIRETNDIQKAIKNIEKQQKEKDQNIKKLTSEISQLEKNIKSVKPTVEAINRLLNRFGFKGFKLQSTKDDKHYCIIREDGTNAKKTLSEGERNFIVFLYFYHLIQGVLDPEENITDSKIVVFDDPISSLDSDVLFIVATLIKNIVRKVRNNESNITQVFVLTHNIFFFKEVSYISQRENSNRRNDTMYYILRKSDNISNIESYEINPIKTTYQLLWGQLKKDRDCISIQNTMRRIIEFYFKLLAEMDEEELIEKFEYENDKKICRSLISWMNVGSHDVFSEIDYSPNSGEIEKFKQVFKDIFEKTGHIAHYNMMMGIDNYIPYNKHENKN